MGNTVRTLFLALLLTAAAESQAEPPAAAINPASVPGMTEAAPPYGISITMTQADKVLAAAQFEAARLGSRINAIAVVDTHGELVVFARMDDATIHSIAFAQQKARSAARSRRASATPPPEMAAALTSMPDFVAMPGGVPIVLNGKTIGAIGVSGGNDLAIALAGVNALKP
ncbi:MAG: heme-binding protein [Steroidobacteraceae bacterium]